jgi:hypothetical protein
MFDRSLLSKSIVAAPHVLKFLCTIDLIFVFLQMYMEIFAVHLQSRRHYFVEKLTFNFESSQMPTNAVIALVKMTNGLRKAAAVE